ncbi:hypothetical protein [Bradyrhizobium sp. USDA 4452]
MGGRAADAGPDHERALTARRQFGSIGRGAIGQLTASGQAGNPYAGAIGSVATNLLGGGGAASQNGALSQNLADHKAGMAPYTAADYSTINSVPVQNALQQVQNDVTSQVNGQFAAAGRPVSGMNTQTLPPHSLGADRVWLALQEVSRAHQEHGYADPTRSTAATNAMNALTRVEPPQSWRREARERFFALPWDLQLYIVEREGVRDRALRRAQNAAAARRKVA